MNLRKSLSIFLSFLFLSVIFITDAAAQERSRIVQITQTQQVTQSENKQTNSQESSRLIKRPTASLPTGNSQSRPTLTNDIVVVGAENQNQQSLIKKTASSQPVNPAPNYSSVTAASLNYGANFNQFLLSSIQGKIGIPYRYGSNGPNSYDCSSFVWSVFGESGISFERSSARNFWAKFEPVSGDDRYKFGTLVFFNNLGHMGIVADENGFYHASVSKGVTYSKFEGYWQKRIVGFRRIPKNN